MQNRRLARDLWEVFVNEGKQDFSSLSDIFHNSAVAIDPFYGLHMGIEGLESVCRGWYESYKKIPFPKLDFLKEKEGSIIFDWSIKDLQVSEEKTQYDFAKNPHFKGRTHLKIYNGKIASFQYTMDLGVSSLEKTPEQVIHELMQRLEQTIFQIAQIEMLSENEALVASCYIVGRTIDYTRSILGFSKKTIQLVLDQISTRLNCNSRKALFDRFQAQGSLHLFYGLFDIMKSIYAIKNSKRILNTHSKIA